jgi:hypothetical protein
MSKKVRPKDDQQVEHDDQLVDQDDEQEDQASG